MVERQGNFFNVMSVVNPRDFELRKRIFAREQAIIDALPGYEFDFGIITRMDHPLDQVVTDALKPAYSRQ